MKSNSNKAISFLKLLDRQTHNLVAIEPDTGEICGVSTGDYDRLKDFIDENSDKNLYFSINEPLENSPDKKLKKTDIKFIRALYIDLDPDKKKNYQEERERLTKEVEELQKSEMPPTYIIDSGGGFQAVWQVLDDLPASLNRNHAEAYGRGLEEKYKSDPVHDTNRILRLPYTINYPDKKKREHGRSKSLSSVIYASKKMYRWEDAVKLAEPIYETEADNENIDTSELKFSVLKEPLGNEIRDRFAKVCKEDERLRRIVAKEMILPSRSEYDLILAGRLKELGWNLQDTAAILYKFKHGKNSDLTAREIIRTYNRSGDCRKDFELKSEELEVIESKDNPMVDLLDKGYVSEEEFTTKRLVAVDAVSMGYKSSITPLFKGLLARQTMVVAYGQSNVGKSFLMLDIAAHLALGKDWGKHKCKEKMAVLYIASEAGQSMGLRVEAVKRRLKIKSEASIRDFAFRVIPCSVDLMSKPTENQDDIGDIILLGKQLVTDSGLKLGMVVIDTLATTFAGGNENSSQDMGLYITNCKRIQESLETCVSIVHHSGKDQAAGARGHSSLRAATDTELEVKAEQQGKRWLREMNVKKQREGESNITTPFGLNISKIGLDDDGDPITTCNVVLSTDSDYELVAPKTVDSLSENQKSMLYAIKIANGKKRTDEGTINYLYKYLLENPVYSEDEIDILIDADLDITPVKTSSFGAKRNSVTNARNKLLELRLIKKDDIGNFSVK